METVHGQILAEVGLAIWLAVAIWLQGRKESKKCQRISLNVRSATSPNAESSAPRK